MLVESWEMVKRPINQRVIGIGYIAAIDDKGVAAYKKLKKHFGASSLLKLMQYQRVITHSQTQAMFPIRNGTSAQWNACQSALVTGAKAASTALRYPASL